MRSPARRSILRPWQRVLGEAVRRGGGPGLLAKPVKAVKISTVRVASDYREALAFALDVEPAALPQICEHTERPIVPGVFIRTALDEHQLDRSEAFDVLVPLFADRHVAEFERLFEHTRASGDVVAVVCEPSDDLAFLLDQITPYDAIWMVLNGSDLVALYAIGGSLAANPTEAAGTSLAELGVDASTPVLEFVRTMTLKHQHYAVAVGV
ncbi:hypothetical protein [Nocardia sp. R7R-8]|uniref:hypothetical protein n=1 Tax=Nocardia sp. R7R-8 TaxID=3459304 RepID=UPI00403E183C